MRRGLLVALIILLPMANAIALDPPQVSEIEPVRWSEVVIVLDSDNWDSSLWQEINEAGAYPIRVLNHQELLVWQSNDIVLSSEFTILESQPAEWRSTLDPTNLPVMEIKILFEPRLPALAFTQIEQDLRAIGIENEHVGNFDYSVMPQKITVPAKHINDFTVLAKLPGILWIEPVLPTVGRNLASSAYMSDGDSSTQPHWEFGLNGAGVVLGTADSGIDADHACFRGTSDAVGDFGAQHRKVLISNITIDDGDNPGQSDYRHGTHVAGSLACHDVYNFLNNEIPTNASTIAYGAKLIFQDIVSPEGWVPPENVTDLLFENTINGGLIHSNSWGDDTTAYTDRSADFDLWAIEVPWSLAFVAPGNTGGQLLEPANGRNVVAVSASTKSTNPDMWASSSVGPTELGTYGIFASAPGASINSAKADGFDNSMNNALRVSSGTSMATPIAASFSGIIQQMVEQGWFTGSNELLTEYNLSNLVPEWSDLPNERIYLGEGFTPSGSLMRSLMAIATKDMMTDDGYFVRNVESGWGALSLNELVDLAALENSLGEDNLSATPNVWIHDSYRSTINLTDWVMTRLNGVSTADISDNPWNGNGAVGPFLQSGETWKKRLVPNQYEDFEIVLSFPAKPEPFSVDDLRLIVNLSNGFTTTGEVYDVDGYSSFFNNATFDLANFNQSNETSIGVKISADDLVGVEWLDVEVVANYIAPGNSVGGVGVDGDRSGFALAAKGVIRDSINWEDSDGDGLPNANDACPNQNAQPFDSDNDGCPDDSDNDEIIDVYDLCPDTDSSGYDDDLDGCIDDSDGDTIGDDVDLCVTKTIDDNYPVNDTGCRPVDNQISITNITIAGIDEGVWSTTLEVTWRIIDEDFDPYLTGARIMINQTGNNSFFPINTCTAQDVTIDNNTHICRWHGDRDLPIFDISDYGLHIQFFAKSLNQSPEAVNDIIYVDSELYFVAASAKSIAGENHNEEFGVASSARSIGWGIITIFAIALVCRKLWSVINENTTEPRNNATYPDSPFVTFENE